MLIALLSSTTVQAADSSQLVTVHQHVNFGGRSHVAGEGEVTIQELRGSVGNDRISSITVEPGYSVLACQNSRLRGRCEVFSSNVSDLRTISFNDVISSLLISKSADSSPVAVYTDVNFNGRFLGLEEGEVTIQGLRDSVGNDRISSITIEPGYSVLACQNSRLGGRCEVFTSESSDLRTISFNDVISSLNVTKLADQSPVTVYRNVNFSGNSLEIDQEGEITIQDLRDSSVGNDAISSIQITDGYSVFACKNSRLGGSCETFTSSILDLRSIGFNDTISSLTVTRGSDTSQPNRAPVASDLALQTTADVPIQFTLADLESAVSDADDDALTILVNITNVAGNSLTRSGDTFTFDPRSFFTDLPSGEAENVIFTYSVTDTEDATVTANINIRVDGVATQPQAAFTVRVRVTEPDGDVIAGVDISDALTGKEFGSTDQNGNAVFEISDVVAQMNLRLTAASYGDQITPLSIVNGAASAALEITMIERIVANAVLTDDGAEVNIGSSFEPVVSWSDDSFVTQSGEVMRADQITLLYTTVDVSNPAELEAFPGSFTGTQLSDGSSTSIASLGTSEYVFLDRDTGAELQLADGATAQILLPLYIDTNPANNETISTGDLLPIWSLNESTGVWNEEAEGTVVASNSSPTGMAVVATVSHFSWWNIDVPIDTGFVTINIDGNELDGTVGVTATSSDVAFRTGFGSVPIGGSYSTEIPAGSEYCFSGIAQLSSGIIGSTNNVCANISAGASVAITLTLDGVDAPLALAADSPVGNAGSVLVNGFTGVPTRRVRINPTSFESDVTYTATNLPAGISLTKISNIGAELVGIPESGGVSNVVVTGTNEDGEADNVSVRYEIEALASVQELTVLLFGSFEENTVRLNENNPGGTNLSVPPPLVPPAPSEVVRWELVGPDPFPEGLFFDESNGEFFIPFDFLFADFSPDYWDWTGLIRGIFPDGRVVDYSVTFIFR